MSYSVNWSTKLISIPQSDLLLISAGVYQLDLGEFHKEIRRLEWEFLEGLPWPYIINYNSVVTIGGVPYAALIEVVNGYIIEFEDGAYAVNIVGANSNVADVTIVNNVSIRPANSAGLINLDILLAAAYQNVVVINNVTGQSGTQSPLGTRKKPSSNFDDSFIIAQNNGISTFEIAKSMVLTSPAIDFKGLTFISSNPAVVKLTIDSTANVLECLFRDITLEGTLDGNSIIRDSQILDLDYVSGVLRDCSLNGLVSVAPLSQANLIKCFSGVAGGGASQTANVNLGGSGSMIARGQIGGLTVSNVTGGGDISLDFDSGRCIIDTTCTAGAIYVRGICDVFDGSTGACIVYDQTTHWLIAQIPGAVWAHQTALDLIDQLQLIFNNSEVLRFIETHVFLDPVLIPVGDGSLKTPFKAINDALDLAETNGTRSIIFRSDIILDRDVKNFNFQGVGVQEFDAFGFDLKNCKFNNILFKGLYTSAVIVQESILLPGAYINGNFENCSMEGLITVVNGSTGSLIKDSVSTAEFIIDMNLVGTGELTIKDHKGNVKIINVNSPTDKISVSVMPGRIIIDPSCTDGSISASGIGILVDNSGNGIDVTKEGMITIPAIVVSVWSATMSAYTDATTFGGHVANKLLTVLKFLALK